MAKFRGKKVVVDAYRVAQETTIDYPTPLVIPKTWWAVRYDDGMIECWSHPDFIAEFVPIDQEARDALK